VIDFALRGLRVLPHCLPRLSPALASTQTTRDRRSEAGHG
jgi:hypothetical protein